MNIAIPLIDFRSVPALACAKQFELELIFPCTLPCECSALKTELGSSQVISGSVASAYGYQGFTFSEENRATN